MKRKHRQNRVLRVESLENRELMAADISFDRDHGILAIKLSGGEHISVNSDGAGFVTVKSRSGQLLNPRNVRHDEVTQIHINGSNQRDEIFLHGVGDNDFPRLQQTHIQGHGGDDHIVGSQVRDLIFGQAGEDFIDGQGGDDKLWGGRHNDVIWGGAGADELYGEGGNDKLYGAAKHYEDTDRDRIDGGRGRDFAYIVHPEDELIRVRRRS